MKISFYLNQLKTISKTPEGWALLALLLLTFFIIIAGITFLPTIIAIITSVVFIGVAIFLIYTSLSLISMKKAFSFEKSKFETIVEHLHDGIVIYDLNFKILKLNKAAQTIFQIQEAEILGRTVDPNWIHQSRFKLITQVIYPSLAPFVHQLSESDSWPQIVEIITENPALNLETTLHRLTDNKGTPVGFLKIIKDRTREKAILQSKTEFIDVAAHQLRTPLTAINWALENLKKITLNSPKEIKDTINQTASIAARALKITNDLLDASKIEDGKFGFNFKNIDFIDFLNEVVETAKPIAKQYSINLVFNHSFTKRLFLNIDPEKLGTAILNIIENAIKYNTENGKVSITASEEKNGHFVLIKIEDTGVGISEEDKNKMFTKFFRGANVQQLEPNGTGLGLYITKNIIEKHGGQIDFDSILNRGTRFWFTLPINQNFIPQTQNETGYTEYL